MVINIVASLSLIGPLGHVGVALATAIAAWLNTALLAVRLARENGLSTDLRLRRRFMRIVVASAAMGLALWLMNGVLATWFAGDLMEKIGALVALIVAGLVVYAAAALGLGAANLADLRAQFRKQSA